MRELMDARYPVYAKADIVVESRDVPHDSIVVDILERLARALRVAPPPAV
jgi:shikimate kinase